MANSHRKNNEIKNLRINGKWIKGEEDLRQGTLNAFRNLLLDPRDWRVSAEGLKFSRLNERDVAKLEVSFTEEEVRVGLNDLNVDKAPGPDSYKVAFW